MKIDLSGWLILIIVASVLAIGGGYCYSYSSRAEMAAIWKQTLMQDCTNRMRDIDAKKKHVFLPTTSPDIQIETANQTLHIKKDSTHPLTPDEGSFLADQYYLSLKNPVKLNRLDYLFQLKLAEHGYVYKTAVSLYKINSEKKVFYGVNNVNLLPNYLKLIYKVDLQDIIVLHGYVQGGWLERLCWGKNYYILLSMLVVLALLLLVVKRIKKRQYPKYPKVLKQLGPGNEQFWQPRLELQPVLCLQLATNVYYLDVRRHLLVYADKTISLAPKVFDLFYQLSQGQDYFQSYDFLLQTLWIDKAGADKKHLEQLVIRLRKALKCFPDLTIETIRGNGYQIKGKNDEDVIIEFYLIVT